MHDYTLRVSVSNDSITLHRDDLISLLQHKPMTLRAEITLGVYADLLQHIERRRSTESVELTVINGGKS